MFMFICSNVQYKNAILRMTSTRLKFTISFLFGFKMNNSPRPENKDWNIVQIRFLFIVDFDQSAIWPCSRRRYREATAAEQSKERPLPSEASPCGRQKLLLQQQGNKLEGAPLGVTVRCLDTNSVNPRCFFLYSSKSIVGFRGSRRLPPKLIVS